ncbi:unnamed protein product [Rhodiola kirilowii]
MWRNSKAAGPSSHSRRLPVAQGGGAPPLATSLSGGRSSLPNVRFVQFCAVFSQNCQCVSSPGCLDSTPDSSN